jgi:hypothetical protein
VTLSRIYAHLIKEYEGRADVIYVDEIVKAREEVAANPWDARPQLAGPQRRRHAKERTQGLARAWDGCHV